MDKDEVISNALAQMDNQILNTWKLYSKVGSGSFGEVYLGVCNESRTRVAVKIVLLKSDKNLYHKELRAYDRLKNGVGIPELIWHGYECEAKFMGILVMQLLGPSLRNLLDQCNGQFTLRTVLALADQMITRLEFIHSNDIIHQDIKPDNFTIGLGPLRNTVYLIDFGLSNIYRNSETRAHITEESNLGLIGSLKYSSVNSQNGNRQSRRDDLESLGYTLILFLKGRLPWSELKSDEIMSRRDKVMKTKSSIPIRKLCKNLPEEFRKYMDYCRRLKFEEKPDYEYCREIFKHLYIKSRFNPKCSFDWAHRRK